MLPTHQHGFRAAHSTTTALDQINNTILTGFNKKKPSHRTIFTALDMTKVFDTVKIHQLIHKIHNTHIPTTKIKFLANYLKGRRQYTSYNNNTSKHTNIKAGVPQGGILSPTLFNIYFSDIPFPKIGSLNLITYAVDITITSSHPNINTATQNLLLYLHEIHTWAHNNNQQINPTKTTSTLMTPDPSEYNKPLNIHINNIPFPTTFNPTILGLTFDPKLKYFTYTDNTITKAKKTLNLLKLLTSTHWGKSKETLITTYKTLLLLIIEYANTIWSPIISSTSLNKFQKIQNAALRTITGCTLDTNTQHLHSETKIFPLQNHLKLHASQLTQKAFNPTHSLHPLTTQEAHPKYKKQSTFNNNINYTLNIPFSTQTTSHTQIKNKMKTILTKIVHDYISSTHNKTLSKQPSPIHESETTLDHHTRRTLAQLRSNKSSFIFSYLNKISPSSHPSPSCPLC